MAKFNPDTGVDPGSQYDFKGAMPNQGFEVALKGSANAVGDFVQSMDTAVTTDINERARAGEESIQDNLFNTADLAVAQSSTTNAGVAEPEDLSRGFGKMQRLKNAYAKGAITESDYLSSIDVLTKSLRSRYGDKWANQIDSAVAGAVSNSANAYRRQLFQEWDAGKTAADKAREKESDRKYNLVKENMQYLYGRSDIIADPDQFGTNEIMHEIMKVKVPQTLTEQALTEFRLAKERGEVTDEDTLKVGKRLASSFLNTIVDQSGASINNTMMTMIQRAKADGTVDKAEKENILAYISSAQPHIEQGLNKLLMSDDFVTMRQKDKDEIVAMGGSVVKMYRDMIFDDKTGLFAMTANRRAWAAEDAITKAMNLNPDLANTVVMKDAFDKLGMTDYANQLAEQYLIKNPAGTDAPEFRLTGALLVGEKNLNEYIQAAWDAKGDGKKVVEVFKNLRDAVTSENTATKAKAQAASVLFAPENSEFMTSGMVDGALATRIYNELTTGEMVKTMSAMKGTDMVTWDNYYNWVFDPGFKAVFQYEINTVLPNANNVRLQFNSDTMTFSSKGTVTDPRSARSGQQAVTSEADNFVKRMNIWIKKVTPILESNGDDVVYEINRIFEANGIAEAKDSEKQSFMQKALEAVVKEKEKQEKEEAATTIPE